jgi:hypothetical protein
MAINFDHTATGNVTIKSTSVGTITLTLPSSNGLSDYMIITDGTGNLSFSANATNIAIAAFAVANTLNVVPAFTQANTANSNAANASNIAVAAFAKANTIAPIVLDTVNATRYITFDDGVSGSAESNVSYGLTYNPSSNALTVAGSLTVAGNPVTGIQRPRTISYSSLAIVQPNTANTDQINITALAVAANIYTPLLATPALDGQKLIIRLKDDGTIRNLTWNTGSANTFRTVGTTLPSNTVTASKVTYVGCIYNNTEFFWDVVAVTTQA